MVGCPGLGCAAAALSSSSDTNFMKEALSAGCGCGNPAGGICPEPTLRRAFSQVVASRLTLAGSRVWTEIPAVFTFSLWQPTQYCLSTVWGPGADCCAAAGISPTKITARYFSF